MKEANIKEKVIHQIQALNDDRVLEEIYSILQGERELSRQQEDELTDGEAELLIEASRSVKAGNYSTNEEVRKRAKEWLNE
jgi:predicted nucleic acid-binding protein